MAVPEQSFTSGCIADLVDGRLVGRDDIKIAGVAPLERAGPGELSFFYHAGNLDTFQSSKASAALVEETMAEVSGGPDTRVVVADVRVALARVLAAFSGEETNVWGVSSKAVIGRGSRWIGRISIEDGASLGRSVLLGKDCVVGRYASIGDGAVIGDSCVIGAHATVGKRVVLGHRVVLQPGARVGGAGYSFASTGREHLRLKHEGVCRLGDDVEVGANTTIDRGTVGETVVGAGTKIDNLVQVGHNVRIGERCLIMAQVGLAGSTVLEDDVMLAGQAGLAGHLTIGRGARVAAQAGVIGDIPAGSTVSGYPARPHRDVLRQTAALRKITPMMKAIERIVEADVKE